MTFAPQTLKDLATLWVAHGGVNLGIVGDTAHLAKGVSYHLGKSQLIAGAYSARTARDRAGLTEAASAIDLGKLGGSLTRLRVFSSWFVSRCRANEAGTRDVREVIWTPNGKNIYGWSREAGVNSAPIPNYGDASHLYHTHISFYRDSEKRDKRPLFAPYFKPPGHQMHAAPGTYDTYTVTDHASKSGSLKTANGFGASCDWLTARYSTGTISLIRLTSGVYKGRILHRVQKGITST